MSFIKRSSLLLFINTTLHKHWMWNDKRYYDSNRLLIDTTDELLGSLWSAINSLSDLVCRDNNISTTM